MFGHNLSFSFGWSRSSTQHDLEFNPTRLRLIRCPKWSQYLGTRLKEMPSPLLPIRTNFSLVFAYHDLCSCNRLPSLRQPTWSGYKILIRTSAKMLFSGFPVCFGDWTMLQRLITYWPINLLTTSVTQGSKFAIFFNGGTPISTNHCKFSSL